jgi:N-acetylneuraminic acid mutarotase
MLHARLVLVTPAALLVALLVGLLATTAGPGAASAAQASAGGPGALHGLVVDHTSGQPVAGAHVTLTGGSSQPTEAQTGEDGRYVVQLVPGDYDLLVTAFGYTDARDTVRMTNRGLLAHRAELEVAPEVVLRGHVSDASGAGWPLYAHVGLPGTSLETFTDPTTGDYRLRVPGGHTYDVAVEAVYPGYETRTDAVRVDGRTTHDVGLGADAATCTAPGYTRGDGVRASFDGDTAPEGWMVVDHFGGGVLWRFDDPAHRGNLTGGAGGFATVDSIDQTTSLPDVSLVSPVTDLSAADHPVLEFATELLTGFPAMAEVELSVDAGATWSPVWSTQASLPGPQTVRVPLPDAAGAAQAQIRFHYLRGPGRWWWQVDDVFLGDATCAATPGGLVVGSTRSSLTGRALDDVAVAVDGPAPFATTSHATPDDPRLADGFYWLVTAPGQHQVTASAPEHAETTEAVEVEAGDVRDLELRLASGRLVATPRTIRVEVDRGRQATAQLTVVNTGDAPATFSLEEVEGAPPPATPRGTTGAAVQRVPADVSPLPDRGDAGAQPPARPAQADEAGDWRDLAPYPLAVRDTVAGSLDGTVYSFGGYGAAARAALTSSFRYDAEGDHWVPIADLPQPRQQPSGAFIDGRFVLAGGWGADEHPVAETVVYDPVTDSWSTAAPNPAPLAASGTAVLDGELYVVGGCLDNDCGRTDVLRYDPEADAWTRLADYPQNTAWTSCGGIRGKVYCAGGIGTGADKFAVFAYDPQADSWTRVADLPLDMWASAYSVVDDHLVVVGGAAEDSSTVTNEGYSYDAASDSWSALPPSHHAFLRASGACGFVKIGGKLEAWDGFPDVELLPGYDDCRPSTDLPWVQAGPDRAVVGPGGSTQVRLDVDATDLTPGVHVAYLRVRESTPFAVRDVTIRVVVRP